MMLTGACGVSLHLVWQDSNEKLCRSSGFIKVTRLGCGDARSRAHRATDARRGGEHKAAREGWRPFTRTYSAQKLTSAGCSS